MPTPEQTRRYNLKKRYDITPQRYEELLQIQGGRCAICHRVPRTQRLHVDHSHRTGAVRGLLCLLCNRALEATVMAHERRARENGMGRCTCFTCEYWSFPPAKLLG